MQIFPGCDFVGLGLKSISVVQIHPQKTTPKAVALRENCVGGNLPEFFQFSPVNVFCGAEHVRLLFLGERFCGMEGRSRMTMGNAIR